MDVAFLYSEEKLLRRFATWVMQSCLNFTIALSDDAKISRDATPVMIKQTYIVTLNAIANESTFAKNSVFLIKISYTT